MGVSRFLSGWLFAACLLVGSSVAMAADGGHPMASVKSGDYVVFAIDGTSTTTMPGGRTETRKVTGTYTYTVFAPGVLEPGKVGVIFKSDVAIEGLTPVGNPTTSRKMLRVDATPEKGWIDAVGHLLLTHGEEDNLKNYFVDFDMPAKTFDVPLLGADRKVEGVEATLQGNLVEPVGDQVEGIVVKECLIARMSNEVPVFGVQDFDYTGQSTLALIKLHGTLAETGNRLAATPPSASPVAAP